MSLLEVYREGVRAEFELELIEYQRAIKRQRMAVARSYVSRPPKPDYRRQVLHAGIVEHVWTIAAFPIWAADCIDMWGLNLRSRIKTQVSRVGAEHLVVHTERRVLLLCDHRITPSGTTNWRLLNGDEAASDIAEALESGLTRWLSGSRNWKPPLPDHHWGQWYSRSGSTS